MQRLQAIRRARPLVVASDRWTAVLVRRQAHAFEIIAGVACAGFSPAGADEAPTNVVSEKPGNPLDSQARLPDDLHSFEARWRARVGKHF